MALLKLCLVLTTIIILCYASDEAEINPLLNGKHPSFQYREKHVNDLIKNQMAGACACYLNGKCLISKDQIQCLCNSGYGKYAKVVKSVSWIWYCLECQCGELYENVPFNCTFDSEKIKTCDCPNGYTETFNGTCQALCHNVTCQNGGKCIVENNTASCVCENGYFGDYCQIDSCRYYPNYCRNGGICLPGKNGTASTCECKAGYGGKYCEIDACDQAACQNGTCERWLDKAYCLCDIGFSGEKCDINLCEAYPCFNGGTCIVSIAAKCECPPGFTGFQCEYKMISTEPPTQSEETNEPTDSEEITSLPPVTSIVPSPGPCPTQEQKILHLRYKVLDVFVGSGQKPKGQEDKNDEEEGLMSILLWKIMDSIK